MSNSSHSLRRWTDVFVRSRVSPCVFNVRRGHVQEATKIAVDAGLATEKWASPFDNYFQSTALLDGLILFTWGSYGWEPGLKRGERIVGYQPFRLLCTLMDLNPPRCLKGEESVADPASLLEYFKVQQMQPMEALLNRAKLGIKIRSHLDLICLAQKLFPESEELFLKRRARFERNR